jgi:hypothetical protein
VGTIDNATWFALASVLTLLGMAGTYLLWQRRGPASGVRGLAWTLLPGAAYLTGTLRLLGNILADVGDWAARLVFSPTVWLGIAVAGVSAALFAASGLLRRRGIGTKGRRPKPGAKKTAPGQVSATSSRTPAVKDEDLADIEAILKKHGIS